MRTDSIRLNDLAEPQFSPEIAALRANMAAMAHDLDFAPDAMRSQAASEIGLDGFGDREYEAPFEVLASAVDGSEILSGNYFDFRVTKEKTPLEQFPA